MPPELSDDLAPTARERILLERALVALLPEANRTADGFTVAGANGSPLARIELAGARTIDPASRAPDPIRRLRIAPLFPGSFQCGTLRLSPDAGAEPLASIGVPGLLDTAPEPDWHHASMTWRPAGRGRVAAAAPGSRIAAFLCSTDVDTADTAAAIAAACHPIRGVSGDAGSLQVIGPGALARRVAAQLERVHGSTARGRSRAVDRPRAFFDALAGIDVALFAGRDGRFVDAIDCGVRVLLRPAPCGGAPAGTALPAEPSEQLDWLENRRRSSPDRVLVANDSRALHDALHAWLLAIGGSDAVSGLLVPEETTLVIPRHPSTPAVPLRAALRLDGPARKFAKFRESPRRFASDSRLPLLRALARRS